jgi:hypothetical protein
MLGPLIRTMRGDKGSHDVWGSMYIGVMWVEL